MRYFIGGRRDLDRIFLEIEGSGAKVYGPKKRGGNILYGKLSGTEDIPIGKGGISSATHHSVKEILHPPVQPFLLSEGNYASYLAKEEVNEWALFAVRPCDIASMAVMDSLLSEDPLYRRRRAKLSWVVVEECLEPGIFCFCSSLGTGPSAEGSFDISFAVIGKDCILFRGGSRKGEDLLSSLPLRELDEGSEELQIYRERIRASAESMKKRFRESVESLEGALERSAGDTVLWRRLSADCVGCSNCNMACPTCSCTEFLDEIKMDGSAERSRVWIGCLSPVYGQAAGIHFRREQYMRYRHFVLHKFLFSKKKNGFISCVGCGRCIAACPMGLDLRNALQEVMKSYGSK